MPALGYLPYKPAHLEDETLYSYLARAQLLNCIASSKQFLASIFGVGKATLSSDLPTGLACVLELWPEGVPYQTLDELIERTTQYPYHHRFMSEKRWQAVARHAASGLGSSMKTSIGLVAQRFGATTVFRSCPQCNRESWSLHGAVYWHRSHLLPGVLVCSRHQVPLEPHFVQSLDTARSLRPLLPNHMRRQPSASSIDCMIQFAETSAAALHDTRFDLEYELQRATHFARLKEIGLLRGDRQVLWKELSAQVLEHHHQFEGWPTSPRLRATTNGTLGWLHGPLSVRARLSHPLTHIVLINFLYGSFSGYREAALAQSNSPADFRPDPVRKLCVSLLEDESLSCREAASRLGTSVTTVVQQRRKLGIPIAERRKTSTRSSLARARRLLGKGRCVADIVRSTGLSASSIYRLRSIAYPDSSGTSAAGKHEALVKSYRCRWVSTERHGSLVRAKRAHDSAPYSWPYRQDREWLTQQHGSRAPFRRRVRIDWPGRDAMLAERAERTAEALKRAPGRKRISATALIRSAGPESSIRRNMYRLPLLRGALQKQSESVAAFQRARFVVACATLAQHGASVPLWKALRAARMHHLPPSEEKD